MSGKPEGRATSLGMSSSFTPSTLFNQLGVFCLPLFVIPGMSCRHMHYILDMQTRALPIDIAAGTCMSRRVDAGMTGFITCCKRQAGMSSVWGQ